MNLTARSALGATAYHWCLKDLYDAWKWGIGGIWMEDRAVTWLEHRKAPGSQTLCLVAAGEAGWDERKGQEC